MNFAIVKNKPVGLATILLVAGITLNYFAVRDGREFSWFLIAMPFIILLGQKAYNAKSYKGLYANAAKNIESFVAGKSAPEEWNEFLNRGMNGDIKHMELQRFLADIPNHYPATEAEHYCSPQGVEQMLKIAEIIKEPNWTIKELTIK